MGPKKKKNKNETLVAGRGVWGLCSAQLCCEPKAAPKIEICLKHGKSRYSVIRVVNSGSEGGAGLLLTCPWLPWLASCTFVTVPEASGQQALLRGTACPLGCPCPLVTRRARPLLSRALRAGRPAAAAALSTADPLSPVVWGGGQWG